jgi:hypothetical protein
VTIYSLGSIYRIFVFFMTAFFGLGVTLTTTHLVTANEPTDVQAFLVLWILVAVYGLYWYLFRYAYDLRFDRDFLYWRSPLRSGKLLLNDLRRVRVRWGTDAILVTVDGSRLHALAQKGFARFCAKLAAEHPQVEVQIGLMSRFLELFPGSTPFRG